MYLQRFQHYVEIIQRHMTALQQQSTEAADDELESAFNGLELLLEEVETSEEAAQVIEEELLHQIQQLAEQYQHYQELFQSAPIAYLIMNAQGLILEANQALANLFNVPQPRLRGKPFVLFVADSERQGFYNALSQVTVRSDQQRWQIRLAPREGQNPVGAELHVKVIRTASGDVQHLWIGIFVPNQMSETEVQITQPQPAAAPPDVATAPALPRSLDGLRVLFVDDEADAREFVTAVLEAQGIHVTAVDSAAAALEALERSRPDVLVSDIRMADQDGYALIRRVRELEAEQGWHVPAAALTAYLDESREKALTAGFEAHLHKLARPDELIALLNRLSEQQAVP
jgi:PAS domain S-box-containing protein